MYTDQVGQIQLPCCLRLKPTIKILSLNTHSKAVPVMCNLMRLILTILLFLKLGLVLGQPANFFVPPEIIKVGKTMSSFVPKGWTIVDSTIGDLNGDHKMDIAFVIKSNDSLISYSFIEFIGEEKVNRMEMKKYPRCILIIVLKDPVKDSFNLIEQSYSMISEITVINTKIEIENNLLKIKFSSSNSDYNISRISNYYFSYQKMQFLLTKFDCFTVNGQWTENCVIDFISKKLGLTKGKVNLGKPDTVWKNIDDIEPKTMNELNAPGCWYIAEGVMI